MKQLRATLTRLADGGIAAASREQYELQYTLLTNQISDFIDDAYYNGRTLLSTNAAINGGDISAIRNESGGQFTINAVDGATLKLTNVPPATASLAGDFIIAGGDFDLIDAEVSSALNNFGAQMQYVDNQMVYNSKKIDAMEDGLGALVDADLAKESSKLQALQTRQQLGVQTLGIANQGPQVLLSLFR
jgi:flagellin